MRLLPWFCRLTKAQRPDKVCLTLGTSRYNSNRQYINCWTIQSEKKLLCHILGQKLCSKSQTYLSATYWIRVEESIFWLKVHSVFALRSSFYYSHPLNDPLMTCVKIHLHSISTSLIFSSYGFMPVTYLSCISRGQRSTHLLAGLHLWMTNPAVCWRRWLLGEQCKGQALVPETHKYPSSGEYPQRFWYT